MLWTIAVILIILWLLGLVTGYTMGYFILISYWSLPSSSCWSESFRGNEGSKAVLLSH